MYAGDLVRLGNSWEEVENRYAQWKKAMTKKGLKVNVKKMKASCTGKRNVAIEASTIPYAQYVKEKWEETPSHTLNITGVGCTKDVLEYKSAGNAVVLLSTGWSWWRSDNKDDVTEKIVKF